MNETEGLIVAGAGIAAVIGIAYLLNKNNQQQQTQTQQQQQQQTQPPSISTCTSGMPIGNWLTSVGVNWYGAGCYELPDGTYKYFATSSDLQSYAQNNNLIKPTSLYPGVGYNLSTQLGSQANPYLFDNGFVGAGYYQFTQQEYAKLLSIPASGINANPTYMDNLAFYQTTKYWLNYSQSTTVSSTSNSTQIQNTNTTSMQISVSPSSISLTQGATITISGSGFPAYSKGIISAKPMDIGIAGFTADSNGNFDVSASYYYNQSNVSALGNAIADANGNYIDLVAFDYANGKYSNTVSLYFA